MAKKAVQTGKQKKAALLASTAAGKGAADAAGKAAKAATGTDVVTVNPKALSLDVGPKVIQGLAQVNSDEIKAHELAQGIKSKRYDLMGMTTEAIVKAAQNDDGIDLSVAFSGDNKKMTALNEKLGLALGFRESKTYETPNGTVVRMAYAKTVAAYFPQAGDKKGDPATNAKATFRSNFVHMLKKCTQAAVAIIDGKIKMKQDKESGTLLLSGPAIKKQFGADEVLLDEKQTVGAGKETFKLKEKPSFTAMAAAAAKDYGAAVRRGNTSRQAKIGDNKPETVFKGLCDPLVSQVSKLKVGEVPDKVRDILDKVLSAIEAKLA